MQAENRSLGEENGDIEERSGISRAGDQEKFVQVAVISRCQGIHPGQYCKWSKEFLEPDKKRLTGDTVREATSGEVDELREENEALKKLVAELSLKKRVLEEA